MSSSLCDRIPSSVSNVADPLAIFLLRVFSLKARLGVARVRVGVRAPESVRAVAATSLCDHTILWYRYLLAELQTYSSKM